MTNFSQRTVGSPPLQQRQGSSPVISEGVFGAQLTAHQENSRFVPCAERGSFHGTSTLGRSRRLRSDLPNYLLLTARPTPAEKRRGAEKINHLRLAARGPAQRGPAQRGPTGIETYANLVGMTPPRDTLPPCRVTPYGIARLNTSTLGPSFWEGLA